MRKSSSRIGYQTIKTCLFSGEAGHAEAKRAEEPAENVVPDAATQRVYSQNVTIQIEIKVSITAVHTDEGK